MNDSNEDVQAEKERAARDLKKIQELQLENEELTLKIRTLHLAVKRCDLVAVREVDPNQNVTGYKFKTGAWHALLGAFQQS